MEYKNGLTFFIGSFMLDLVYGTVQHVYLIYCLELSTFFFIML
jgi:hypothetical protein